MLSKSYQHYRASEENLQPQVWRLSVTAAKNSWKENLKAELDELVMRDDVRSIDDLTEKLKEKDTA